MKTRSVEFLAQSAQGKGTEQQSQIAQRNVEVTRDGKQIANNQKEPGRDHVAKKRGFRATPTPATISMIPTTSMS